MNHWIALPIVLPSLMAPFILLAARNDIKLQRVLSISTTFGLLALSIFLAISAQAGPDVYLLGNWPAPFGIVLVLDRLSAIMLVLTALLAVFVVLYAAQGWDTRGRHFHALFQFQLMGLNGAFLTGDVFNLFVFFEVMLIASYGLMLHGAGTARLKAGVQYVAVNLGGSTLFLFAVAIIYGVTGTLNMADLAVKIPTVAPENQGLLQAGGLLLLGVFAVKAALVPLHFWLPGTYAAASAPVAALFAIMTKVGAYSIIRVYTLAFGANAGEASWLAADWLLPAALVTIVVGTAGLLAARTLRTLVCFATVGSMGTLLAAVAAFTPASMGAALFYLLHSTLIVGTLFLLVDVIAARRDGAGDALTLSPRFANDSLLAALFFLAAIAMVGMPPLSGFIGKLMILDTLRATPTASWTWTIILVSSALSLVGFARAGSLVFWKSTSLVPAANDTAPLKGPALGNAPLVLVSGLLATTVVLTVLAGPLMGYIDATVAELFIPDGYIAEVLGNAQTPVVQEPVLDAAGTEAPLTPESEVRP